MKNSSERRSYFRINDIVGLTYSSLDGNAESRPVSVGEMSIRLTDVLADIDNNFNQAVNILWQESPTVAKALGELNKKISIIAAQTLQTEEQPMETYEEIMVNISGSGVAFHCTESLPPETRLRLSIVLKPSNTELKLNGTVVNCDDQSDDSTRPYWMRVHFDETNSVAREQLIQHIVQKQYAQLGRKRSGAG